MECNKSYWSDDVWGWISGGNIYFTQSFSSNDRSKNCHQIEGRGHYVTPIWVIPWISNTSSKGRGSSEPNDGNMDYMDNAATRFHKARFIVVVNNSFFFGFLFFRPCSRGAAQSPCLSMAAWIASLKASWYVGTACPSSSLSNFSLPDRSTAPTCFEAAFVHWGVVLLLLVRSIWKRPMKTRCKAAFARRKRHFWLILSVFRRVHARKRDRQIFLARKIRRGRLSPPPTNQRARLSRFTNMWDETMRQIQRMSSLSEYFNHVILHETHLAETWAIQ